ncbi:MAG: YchJ family metal-binding protein [Gammaproteobacteria bacterium]|nr:YchJ family metal-binding protein [Gammaproteobacteria bacterium]
MSEEQNNCPCGSGLDYEKCCGTFHQGKGNAKTAEALMRSRYAAFAKNNFDYLSQTNHEEVKNENDTEQNRELYKKFEWLGLSILDTEKGQADDHEGFVDFTAKYRVAGGEHTIREKSYFIKQDDKWYYVQGKSLQAPQAKTNKLGRNDPCSCGSGKKYKKCCMNK